MKSILLIMPYGSVGGMERLALTLYDHYKSLGYKVKALKIIRLPSDIINFNEDELYLSGVDFAGMSAVKRMGFYLKAPLLLRKQIKKHRITHSVAFGDMANMFSSLTGTNEYKVASIHALKSIEFTSVSLLNKVFQFGYRSTYKFFDKVVCISEAIKDDIIINCRFAFPQKLMVIYNPHDIPEILRKSEEPINDVFELSLFDKNTIIFLGRLSVQKAPWHLVKAFSILRQKRSDANLVFIGDGDINVEEYVKNTVKELAIPDVHFLGRKSNPYKYLKNASVLALSSYYEGTPNVIVEAIALGVPIVTSNCTDGLFEIMSIDARQEQGKLIITDSGIVTPGFFNGMLSIPDNSKLIEEEVEMSDALQLILNNPSYKARLADKKEELLQKFQVGQVATAYLE